MSAVDGRPWTQPGIKGWWGELHRRRRVFQDSLIRCSARAKSKNRGRCYKNKFHKGKHEAAWEYDWR